MNRFESELRMMPTGIRKLPNLGTNGILAAVSLKEDE